MADLETTTKAPHDCRCPTGRPLPEAFDESQFHERVSHRVRDLYERAKANG